MKKDSLEILRLQWELGARLVDIIQISPLSAKDKVLVLEVIVADLKKRFKGE